MEMTVGASKDFERERVAATDPGSFRCWDEAGGKSMAVAACAIADAGGERKLAIVGQRTAGGEERELGALSLSVVAGRATGRSISMGGPGSGYAVYRLYLIDGTTRTLLAESDGL